MSCTISTALRMRVSSRVYAPSRTLSPMQPLDEPIADSTAQSAPAKATSISQTHQFGRKPHVALCHHVGFFGEIGLRAEGRRTPGRHPRPHTFTVHPPAASSQGARPCRRGLSPTETYTHREDAHDKAWLTSRLRASGCTPSVPRARRGAGAKPCGRELREISRRRASSKRETRGGRLDRGTLTTHHHPALTLSLAPAPRSNPPTKSIPA